MREIGREEGGGRTEGKLERKETVILPMPVHQRVHMWSYDVHMPSFSIIFQCIFLFVHTHEHPSVLAKIIFSQVGKHAPTSVCI